MEVFYTLAAVACFAVVYGVMAVITAFLYASLTRVAPRFFGFTQGLEREELSLPNDEIRTKLMADFPFHSSVKYWPLFYFFTVLIIVYRVFEPIFSISKGGLGHAINWINNSSKKIAKVRNEEPSDA